MDRDKHLKLADDAVTRAERLAGDAERYVTSHDPNRYSQVQRYAEAGAVWADIARTHAAIAAATPEPLTFMVDEIPLLIGGTGRTGKTNLAALLEEAARLAAQRTTPEA